MRSRKEIMEATKDIWASESERIVLEVLLDIRDLLRRKK